MGARVGRPPAAAGGFTLVELLIVVVIIGILAAVALPKLWSAIDCANEGAAVGVLTAIRYAPVLYSAEHRGQFPIRLSNFGPPGGSEIIDAPMVPYFEGGRIPDNPIDGTATSAAHNFVWNEDTKTQPSIVGSKQDGWVYFSKDGGVVINNSDPSVCGGGMTLAEF